MKKIFWCLIILIGTISSYAQVAQRAIDAPNLDFSMGDFTNWKRYYGKFRCDNPNASDQDKTYSYHSWTEVTASAERIKLLGDVSTLDPIMQCDDLQTNPDPGKNVARIGQPQKTEGMSGAGCSMSELDAAAEKLEYTYTITEATSVLKYRFAAVLHLPDHGGQHIGDERPFFAINIKVVKPDGTEATVACSSYSTVVNEFSALLKRGTAPTGGCTASKGNPTEYMYQPWTSAMVDLREYIGSNVTISVITHDCLVRCSGVQPAAGGHEAYGYFRAEAMDLKLSTRVCNEESASIAAPENYFGYNWSRSDHFPISADASTPNLVTIPFADMVPNVTYSCTLSDELGCAAIKLDTKLDPVVLKPSFEYTAKCGGEIEFTSTSTVSGDDMVNWLWDAGEGETSGEISNHKYSKPGDYEVKLTATTKNGCKQSFTKTITVPYFPDLKIDAEPIVCSGKDLDISVQNAEYDSNIEWFSTASGQTFPNETSFITNPTKSQKYTVKVTDNRNCEYTASKEVIVFDKTHVHIKGATVACPSAEVELELVGNDLTNINWNVHNTTDSHTIKVFPTENSTYIATATDKNGCEVEASHSINVHSRPAMNVDAPVACIGSDAVVKISGAQSYLWHDPNYSTYTGGEIVIKDIQETTSMLVTGYNEHGCTNSKVVTVQVQENPIVSIEGDLVRCFNTEDFEITAHGADTYIWNGITEGNPFTAPSDREHHVTVVGKIGNCASEPYKFDLTTLPTPSITAEQTDFTICEGEDVHIKVNGANEYIWSESIDNLSEITVAPTESKTYTVKGVSHEGCFSNELEINVTVNHPDQVSLHVEKYIACPGKPDSAVIAANGALTYQWISIPEIEGVSNNKSDVLHISYDNTTLIKVKGINDNACSSESEIMLNTLPEPVLSFKVEPNIVEDSKPDVRILGLSPAQGISEWYWSMGDGSDVIKAHDSIYTYDINMRTEPFLVEVTAIDENGCVFNGETEVKIWKEAWAPDAFSPNGNGLNDAFGFYRVNYIQDCYFYIYNRLGEIVYEGFSKDDKWDGTYKGKDCPWGTYGWVLKYTSDIDGVIREGILKGQVTLVR